MTLGEGHPLDAEMFFEEWRKEEQVPWEHFEWFEFKKDCDLYYGAQCRAFQDPSNL